MNSALPLHRVDDLTDPAGNRIYNMSVDEARARVARGARGRRRRHRGLVRARRPRRRERSAWPARIDRPLRYFIAKRDRRAVPRRRRPHRRHPRAAAARAASTTQFHPIVHAHGAGAPRHRAAAGRLPRPQPDATRASSPRRAAACPPDLDAIGERLRPAPSSTRSRRWLRRRRAATAPIGVCFSGGIDSGAVFLVAYHALRQLGESPARLKAFTLAVDGGGEDLEQARGFLRELDLEHLPRADRGRRRRDVDRRQAVRVDRGLQAARRPVGDDGAGPAARASASATRSGATSLDGDGGDENLKDYPIEENPELTDPQRAATTRCSTRRAGASDAIKHSLTYSGGLSRGYARTYAPARGAGFEGFSPFTRPRADRRRRGDPVRRADRRRRAAGSTP